MFQLQNVKKLHELMKTSPCLSYPILKRPSVTELCTLEPRNDGSFRIQWTSRQGSRHFKHTIWRKYSIKMEIWPVLQDPMQKELIQQTIECCCVQKYNMHSVLWFPRKICFLGTVNWTSVGLPISYNSYKEWHSLWRESTIQIKA